MDTRKITLIATIAVIALIAVGVGYAYTATTQNDNNSASSNYIVLSQTTYTWGNTALYYDTINDSTGTTFILTKNNDTPADEIATGETTQANKLYGVAVGTPNTLTATTTGTVSTAPYKMTISALDASKFTSYADKYWKYVITFYNSAAAAGHQYQYATWDGNAASWTYKGDDGSQAKNDGIYITTGQNYTVGMYFGGSSVAYNQSYTALSTDVPGATQINAGGVKFTLEYGPAS